MNTPICHTCKRELSDGEFAWTSDWKVLDTSGLGLARWERRYTCDDCEANEVAQPYPPVYGEKPSGGFQ